jgi:hypothetical protein
MEGAGDGRVGDGYWRWYLEYFKARTTVCSSCAERVLWRFVTEVQEEYDLLAWFVGDRICADCIREGFWA